MRNYLNILAGTAIFFYLLKISKKPASAPVSAIDPIYKKEFNLDIIPDGKNNYRSGQITASKLPEIIKKYNIKQIIRMNADGGDAWNLPKHGPTSRATEKAICDKLGCKYIFINAHKGYKPGKGYTQSLSEISALLDRGNVLIHCAHGADRTGGMVGGYLLSRKFLPDPKSVWNYSIKYNQWPYYIKTGQFFGKFDKYAETFIPIPDIKKMYGK